MIPPSPQHTITSLHHSADGKPPRPNSKSEDVTNSSKLSSALAKSCVGVGTDGVGSAAMTSAKVWARAPTESGYTVAYFVFSENELTVSFLT